MVDVAVFYGFGALLLFCSIMVITRFHQVASAVYLIGALFLMAALYATLGADFVAAIQILVYAGAIMVLFLFVIMLLNLDPSELKGDGFSAVDAIMMILTIVGFVVMGFYLARTAPIMHTASLTPQMIAEAGGNTRVVGLKLFQDYVWPFEMASFLILLAIVASVVIARKDAATDHKKTKGHG